MFSDPETNVPYFGLREGNRVADFGAGSGAYSLAMAPRVGGTGLVYAVEVQKDLLDRLSNEAKSKRVTNIKYIWGDVDKSGGSKLADNSVDAVLLANILFQSEQKYSLILEAKRIVKSGGKVIVIDWQDSFNNLGPKTDKIIKPEQVKEIATQAELEFKENFPAGAHHYGLIFIKPTIKL